MKSSFSLKLGRAAVNYSPLRLSERFALLWIYLRHIYDNKCQGIFDQSHNHHLRKLIIFIMLKFWDTYPYCNGSELYPYYLGTCFRRLNKGGSLQLDPIVEILKKYDLRKDCRLLKVPEASNYFELTQSFNSYSFFDFANTVWRIKALAELERCLGRKELKLILSI